LSAFFEKQVAAAMSRLPGLGSKQIRELRARAEQQQLIDLVAACDETLGARPVEFDQSSAERNVQMEQEAADLDLVGAIRYAFGQALPANPEEIRFLRWLAAHPGGTYQEAVAAYGKGDVSLLVGHLVYDRYGCFKKFLDGQLRQSDVLVQRDHAGNSVRYTLKSEAKQAFSELGLI
jgi:hypothetical protein